MEPVYAVAQAILKPPVARGLKWTVEGAHRIPAHGPAILASNHSGYLDSLGMAYLTSLQRRKCRFLAKRELFDKRFLGTALRWIHQIPVDRNTGDAAQALEAAVEAVRLGEVLAVFPEGTISMDLDPMAGKTGTARLAAATGVPVTPVGMWGSHRVLFKHRKPNWKWGIPHVACIGPPVRVGADADIYEATDRIMEAICEQVRRARELYPQEPAPGEDDWWVRPPESAVLHSCSKKNADPDPAGPDPDDVETEAGEAS